MSETYREVDEPETTPHGGFEHEQVRVVRGARTAITIIVAVHSTALGPAIGGCRLRHYPTWQDGLADALRLSAAMTDKCSLAGLHHGGGKVAAILPAGPIDQTLRAALVLDIADLVGSLHGAYLTGPDIGSGPADMLVIHERTGYAFCRPVAAGGSGDSAAATARGVLAALLAGAEHVFGTRSLAERRIGIVGLGGVGRHLSRLLRDRGADLTVADIDDTRRADAQTLGARWSDPDTVLTTDLDILVPAAVGGLITPLVAAGLRCPLVVGPANNQLASDDVAVTLHNRGIVWVPDVLASAGGIVHAVAIERRGLTEDQAMDEVAEIGTTVAQLLTEAHHRSRSPLAVAGHIAHERVRRGNGAATGPVQP